MKEHVIINRLTIQTLSNIQAAAKLYLYTHAYTRTQYMQNTKPNCRLSAAAAGVAAGKRQKSKTQTNKAKKNGTTQKKRKRNKKQVTSKKNNKLISKIKFTSKATTKTHAAHAAQSTSTSASLRCPPCRFDSAASMTKGLSHITTFFVANQATQQSS